MDFYELAKKRRSTRKLKEDAVPAESLNRILDAGRWAPSGGNLQPWCFVLVTDGDIKIKLAEICTGSSKKAWGHFSPEDAKFLVRQGGTPNKSYMKKIPVLIAVSYETSGRLSHDVALGSAWAAIENMLLAATEEGLGVCPYTTHDAEEEAALKEVLHIPKQYGIAAILQLGYAATYPPAPSRKNMEEIVFHQRFK